MNHHISNTAGLVTVSAVVAALASVAPAQATATCTDGSVRCPAAAVRPYAEPQPALGGQTLAQYLSAHVEARLAR